MSEMMLSVSRSARACSRFAQVPGQVGSSLTLVATTVSSNSLSKAQAERTDPRRAKGLRMKARRAKT